MGLRLLAASFLVGLVGLSTSPVGAQPHAGDPSLQNMIGMGVNVRHFGYDVSLWREHAIVKTGQQREFPLANTLPLSIRPSSTRSFQSVSLGIIKDPREIKVMNERLPGSKPFVIEKINHSICAHIAVGKVYVISERQSRSDLGLQITVAGQIPLNYSWPLYIWLYQPAPLTDGYVPVAYDPGVHNVSLVGGNARYSAGFADGYIIPGIGASMSFSAEWGSYRNTSNRLSVGLSADKFVKNLPIWHRSEMNRNFFPALFVTFAAGFESKSKSTQRP
ncbi:MAG: hypothetical protein O2814_03105 [Bacteroidetes bacterium]|nr:hypothetical protein [Bacteroidota bacterium]MDA1225045.1 hypothetical protein [Bacteroidota bacterium]